MSEVAANSDLTWLEPSSDTALAPLMTSGSRQMVLTETEVLLLRSSCVVCSKLVDGVRETLPAKNSTSIARCGFVAASVKHRCDYQDLLADGA